MWDNTNHFPDDLCNECSLPALWAGSDRLRGVVVSVGVDPFENGA
jgi:hypothetical protein